MLTREDLATIACLVVGALMLGTPTSGSNRTRLVRTANYEKMVRKKTKKDKNLRRNLEAAEASIVQAPERGDPKTVYPNDTLVNRLARELGVTTMRSAYIMGKRYQIVYAWDPETDTATLMAFGTHKDLFRGNTPYSP